MGASGWIGIFVCAMGQGWGSRPKKGMNEQSLNQATVKGQQKICI